MILYTLIGAAVLLALLAWSLRKRLDLIAEHARDSVRHLLAAVLMAGTLAGTLWTFSNGQLTLSRWLENLVSVGGIAAALEVGAIYTGWYIGQLDLRIFSAKQRDRAAEFKSLQRNLYKWFYVTAAISAVANFLFRVRQLDNAPLAVFVSAAPIVLIVLFTIKLRPLPTDYEARGRQAAGRALYMLVSEAGKTVERSLRAVGKGHALSESERAGLAFAAAIITSHAGQREGQALQFALNPAGAAAAGENYLTSADIMSAYGVSERTAQNWIAQCPGKRTRAGASGYEAPATAIMAARGQPRLLLPSGGRRRRKTAQPDAIEALPADGQPQSGEGVPQLQLASAPRQVNVSHRDSQQL